MSRTKKRRRTVAGTVRRRGTQALGRSGLDGGRPAVFRRRLGVRGGGGVGHFRSSGRLAVIGVGLLLGATRPGGGRAHLRGQLGQAREAALFEAEDACQAHPEARCRADPTREIIFPGDWEIPLADRRRLFRSADGKTGRGSAPGSTRRAAPPFDGPDSPLSPEPTPSHGPGS